MKTIVMIFLTLVISCNGGGSGGSSSPVLDSRLFEGSATWEANYTASGSNWDDEFQFVGDELYRIQTGTTISGGLTVGPYYATYDLVPLTATSVKVTNQADATDTGVWTFNISGSTLRACDPDNDCLDLIKQ